MAISTHFYIPRDPIRLGEVPNSVRGRHGVADGQPPEHHVGGGTPYPICFTTSLSSSRARLTPACSVTSSNEISALPTHSPPSGGVAPGAGAVGSKRQTMSK